MELELTDYSASRSPKDDENGAEGAVALKPPRRSFSKFASMLRRRSLEDQEVYILDERLYGERQALSFKISDSRGPLFSIDCSELGDDPGISILSSSAGPRMVIVRVSTLNLWSVPDGSRDAVSLDIYLGSGALHGTISKQADGDYAMSCGDEVLMLSGDFASHEIQVTNVGGSVVAFAGNILGTQKYQVKVEHGADAGLILLALLAIDKCELKRKKNTRWEALNQIVQVALGIANLIIATGILTIPYGFVLSGWMCIVIVPTSTIMVGFTAVLLGNVLEELRNRGIAKPSYGDIGRFVFGRLFAPVFIFTSCGECFLMVVFYLVFMSNCLSTAFETSPQAWLWVSVFFIVLAKMIPKRYVVLIDLAGTVLTLFASAAAMYTGLKYEKSETSQSFVGIGGVQGMLTVLGMVAVCAADHPCFADVYNRAKDNQAFAQGVIVGFVVFAISALLLGLITYATMGSAIDQLVLTNIGKDADHERLAKVPAWVGPCANFLLAVKCALNVVSFQRPLLAALYDASWRVAIDLYAPEDLESEIYLIRDSPGKFCGRMSLIVGTLLLSAYLAYQFEDTIDALEALASSLFKSLNGVIIPCWGYYILCGSQLQDSPKMRMLLIGLIVFGFVWLLAGSASTVVDLANRLGQSNEDTETS